MTALLVPPEAQRRVIRRWKAAKWPSSTGFAPYTAYVARLEVFFYVAVAHGVVTTRSSNRIDIDYFKYLPFTKVFTSGDKLHSELFPVFAREDQIFISKDDLKTALNDMVRYYDAMSEQEKSLGSFTYADYPPVEMDNAITRAYDKVMPGWRKGANQPKPPRDPEADKKILAHLRPMMEAINAQRAKVKRRAERNF